MSSPAQPRPPALVSVLTWTVTLTAIVLGTGVVLGTNTRLIGLFVFLPAIMAGFATVRQTVFVAAWSLGVTIAELLYYPDPRSRDALLSVAVVLLFGVAAVVLCRQRIRRNERMARLRFTATAMQREILPPLPQHTPEVVVGGVYEPVDEDKLVGGDVYDVVASPFGTRVLIGDVQGKGLPAMGAAFGIVGAFREAAYREPELLDVVDALESALARHNAFAVQAGRSERFATALVLHIGPVGQPKALAVDCGHLPPILLGRRGGPVPVELASVGLPLGLGDLLDAPRELNAFELLPGECLVLYTDGLSESRSRKGEFYPPERALWAARGVPAERVAEALRRDARAFSRGRQQDDIAILTVQRPAAHPPAPAG
ncbi:serine/threonine-protein phosphatase [Actinospica sp. MGRD01-02]|uniref:Serine/threonine-protein phosphatase n=1 Tax=Actinospica acidithermotolerans TaxID=2828514 RepID=A0A941EC60_9ACTN|nr:PP2C family protein-serine/threonine phosphatase [Actinospica acidithermotolerans]MBR7827767.1 serine/threonine-protein phosphatase [Actinospica acidithermotolerans]